MAGSTPGRNVWAAIIKNFINSLKPRKFSGTLIGTDRFGNKYYEIRSTRQRSSRWFEPQVKDDFQQEMPGEWESWLRGRRIEPPSEEEIEKNYAIMIMKKKNAIEVDAKGGEMTPMQKGIETFPKRSEYEIMPGKPQKE